MSKSKNSGVDPQALIDQYGADTARFYIIFASPPTNTLEWSDESVEGSFRFLKRVWAYAARIGAAPRAGAGDATIRRTVHEILRQANYDLQRHQFNTVASACMKVLNALETAPARDAVSDEGLSILLRLLAPIAPHIAHHLWGALGYEGDVMHAPWPEPDAAALERDEIEYVMQVNGKTRGTLAVAKSADRPSIEALATDAMAKYIENRPVKRIVVVPGRLINVVL